MHNLQKNIDYFEFPLQTWKLIWDIYRGGPVIVINYNGKVDVEVETEDKCVNTNQHVQIINTPDQRYNDTENDVDNNHWKISSIKHFGLNN